MRGLLTPTRMKVLRLSLFAVVVGTILFFVILETGWRHTLYTPTYLTKLGDHFFLVDCHHHRILYNTVLDPHLAAWKTLDEQIASPHSIVSDGDLYVAEHTGRNGVFVYKQDPATHDFKRVQELTNMGVRPHRIVYEEKSKNFYILASNSQTMFKAVNDGGKLKIVYGKQLPYLKNRYTRSFSIVDGFMYFVSGPRAIIKVRYTDDSYEPIATYPMPMYGMNDLFRSDSGWWYASATPQWIVRARSVEDLSAGKHEDVYGTFGLKGTPYYITKIDGRYYLPQITEYSGIISFIEDPENGKISDVKTLFDFGPPSGIDVVRMWMLGGPGFECG